MKGILMLIASLSFIAIQIAYKEHSIVPYTFGILGICVGGLMTYAEQSCREEKEED